MKAPSTAVSARPMWKENSFGRLDWRNAQPQRRRDEQQRGQRDQPQVEAVDPELVVDAELADPRVVGDVLEAAAPAVEVEQQHDA